MEFFMRFSTTDLMALGNPENRPTVIRVWESHKRGWHEVPWIKEQLPRLIEERAAMIAAGTLIPPPPADPSAGDPAPPATPPADPASRIS